MIKKIFFIALGMMGSSLVMAASQDEIGWESISSQAQQSGSVHLLARLYGSWVLDLMGNAPASADHVVTPVTVFAALIGVAGWTLFMLLAGYVGVVGVIRTAQQGEFLGRDWDSTWVLARMLGALILSAPLASTGGSSNLAAGQTLVIRAAVVSSAAADIIWGKTLTAIGRERIRTDKTMKVDVNFTPDQAYGLVTKGYEHGMCYSAKAMYDTGLQQASDAASARDAKLKAIKDCNMDLGLFTDKGEGFFDMANPGFDSGDVVTRSKGDMVVGAIDAWYRPEEVHRGHMIRAATQNVAEQYYFRAFRVGSETVKNNLSDDYAREHLPLIAKEFHSKIKSAVEQQLQAGYHNSATIYGNEAQKYGWVSAGNFYRILATQQTSINAALNAAVSVGGQSVNPEALTSGLASDDLVYYNANRAVTVGQWTQELYHNSVLPNVASAATVGANPGGLMNGGAAAAGEALDSVGLNLFKAGETTDPLVVASTVGHGLVTLATYGKAATFLPAVSKGLKATDSGGTVNSVLTILFIVGVFLGDILPSLPWVYFLFGTIAWLVHVTEMFISAPLWIAAHAAPEGSTHTSNLAAKGYNNMLYVMLYPVLAIGGFVAAMSINWIGMYMLNQMIGEQFANQLGGGLGMITHGLGTLVGFAFLYLACAWIIVNTSFNLIQAFPRTILNWLSTADAGHNAYDQGGHQVLGVGGVIMHKAGGLNRIESMMGKLGPGQKKLSGQAPKNSPEVNGI
jgi:conjugal transfer/type IV secretion protein DotA/TraY